MMRKTLTLRETIVVLLLIILLAFLFGFFGWYVGYYRISLFGKLSGKKDSKEIQYVLSLIESKYDGAVDQTMAIDWGISGVLASLQDPYSFYIPKDQYERLKEQATGQFIGIGMVYNLDGKTPVVATILPNSPAKEVGLVPGTKITKINGKDVNGFGNPVEIQLALRGKEGETVTLSTLLPDGTPKEFTITRKKFTIQNVTLSVLPNKIGHIVIYQFSVNFKEEFAPIVEQIRTQQLKAVIVDLRGNTGGTANMGIFLADQFLKSGVIVKEKRKGETQENVQGAKLGDPLEDIPLVVLVNKSTGSEAEVFAAAVSEGKRGKLIGEKTYGKGTEQDTIPLSDESAIQLTTGKWFTPSGTWIQGKGITPDIPVGDTFTNGQDAILARGVIELQ